MNLLVLEDDETLVKAVELMMAGTQYRALVAHSTRQAEPLLSRADVALVDVILPGEDGHAFVRRIRKAGNYVPVIVTSGVWPPSMVFDRFVDLDIVDFLPKPFSKADLHQKLEKAAKVADDLKVVSENCDLIRQFNEHNSRK